MSTVVIALPVLRGRLRLHIDKGRPWSVVEHLILESLSKRSWQASQLALAGQMPRRVVIEAIVRLMRAGWVQLEQEGETVVFSATVHGLAVAGATELPNASRRIARPVSFVVDRTTGAVFRNRELVLYQESEVQERAGGDRLIYIRPREDLHYDRNDVVKVLLEDDEKFVAADSSGDRPSQRYALIRVRDNEIVDGLPNRALRLLRNVILKASTFTSVQGGKPETVAVPDEEIEKDLEPPPIRSITFSTSDLILDGPAHKKCLEHVLLNAVSRIFIHSTFINEDRVIDLLPLLDKAVSRGVRIDILWGQNEDRGGEVSSRSAVSRLQQHEGVKKLAGSLVIHPFSTRSHAKLIVSDSGPDGAYTAVVGSCNWLSSGFVSYEVSAVARDPKFVSDVVKCFADVSHAHSWVWSELTSELTNLAATLSSKPGTAAGKGSASVVVGAHHNHFALRARDEAKNRIFVMSHRLGAVSSPAIIAPLTAAAIHTAGIRADVYFGRTTGVVHEARGQKLIERAASVGVSIEPIESPRLHAKVLGWDDDSVLITSLNWLSADPVSLTEPKEIGIWIQGAGAAAAVSQNFETARLAEANAALNSGSPVGRSQG